MTFRNEDKIHLSRFKLFLFKDYLHKKKAYKIFNSRKINSIYFDNKNFDMYNHSIEGLVPRKKIRLRYYNDDKSRLLFETKISSAEGRYKISKRIKNTNILNGVMDFDYGMTFPVSIVSYDRSYYSLKNVRITIDENIKYQKYNNKRLYKDSNIVAEIKSSFQYPKDIIEELFPFTKIRFSKYCYSIENVFKK